MNNDILKRDMKLLDGSLIHTQSSLTDFCDADALYDWTNEDFNLYPNVDLTDKKVLTVTASGDHVLNCMLKGASKIDAFDINVFAKYYSSLKCAMIRRYDYYTFCHKMDKVIESIDLLNFKGGMNKNFLKRLSKYFTKDELAFWMYFCYLKENDLFCRIGFLAGGTSIEKSPCYGRKNYNTLKEHLKNTTITYYDSDAINIPNLLDGKKYDYIYLSNILGRIKMHDKDITPTIKLVQSLYNLLDNNGTLFSYCFNDDKHNYASTILTNMYDIKKITNEQHKVFSFTKR